MLRETYALGKEASNPASNSFSFLAPSSPRPREIDESWQVKMCTSSCFVNLDSCSLLRYWF